MESRVRWKSHARFGLGENLEIVSKDYLSISIILQTIQQLKAIYGDGVDKVIMGRESICPLYPVMGANLTLNAFNP